MLRANHPEGIQQGGRGHAEGTHDRKPPDLGTWPHDLLVASMAGNAILKYDWRGNFSSWTTTAGVCGQGKNKRAANQSGKRNRDVMKALSPAWLEGTMPPISNLHY